MAPSWTEAASTVGAVAALVAAIAASYYAWQSRLTVHEMRKAREQADAARVIAFAVPGKDGPELAIANVGRSPAFDVRVVVSRGALKTDLSKTEIAEGEVVLEGMFLAPGQELHQYAVFATLGVKPETYPSTEAECSWADEAKHSHSAISVINFGSLLYWKDPRDLGDIARAIKGLEGTIDRKRL